MSPPTCLACGGARIAQSDFLVSRSHHLFKCTGCGFGFLEMKPAETEVPFDDYWDEINERIYTDPSVVRELQDKYSRYLSVIERSAPNRRLLDVGSGAGIFVAAAVARGFEVVGVEPSVRAVEISRHRGELPIVRGLLAADDDLPRDNGALTLWDVIEHVPDPEALIVACADHLADGGLLVLETPDEGSLLRDLVRTAARLGRRFDQRSYLYYRAHRYYFTRQAMESVLRRGGFARVDFYRDHTMFEKSLLKLRLYRGLTRRREGLLRVGYGVLRHLPFLGNKMVVVAHKALSNG
jgi:SAM-dependent methyltransferase